MENPTAAVVGASSKRPCGGSAAERGYHCKSVAGDPRQKLNNAMCCDAQLDVVKYASLVCGRIMRRREFITLLGSGAISWPLAAYAQGKPPVVGWLAARPRVRGAVTEGFVEGLRDAGFVEDQQVIIDYRSADDQLDRLPALAAKLVEQQVAVIAAPGSMALAAAAKGATSTIPIVFMIGSDPVELGLVKSLSHPGGNLTGVAYLNVEVAAKRLELLHRLVPDAKSIALFVNRENPLETQVQVRTAEAAVKLLGMRLRVFEVASPSDLDAAFASVAEEHIDAVHIGVDGLFGTNRARLIGLAARYRVPTSYPWREFTVEGGLMNYGANIREQFHQVGAYAARILRGEKPADMPVQRPTKFGFVLNLKTARSLGIEVSPSLLALADEVIE
jgi:putative tryptophan/tyrosine transport system substrate-binding protein